MISRRPIKLTQSIGARRHPYLNDVDGLLQLQNKLMQLRWQVYTYQPTNGIITLIIIGSG